MISYYGTGLMLNLASLNQLTRRAYRYLGNLKNTATGAATAIPTHYIERTRSFFEMLRRHDVVLPGMKVMEVGTGWVHWEALMLRNEIACDTILYDVWDNRSFERFRAFVKELTDPALRARLGLQNHDGLRLMQRIADTSSFNRAYDRLGFKYIVDPSGLLPMIAKDSLDFIFASDVAEHFDRDDIPQILSRTFKALKPGGHLYHQIVLTDHLRIYDRTVHDKEYLRFSGKFFDRFLNNKVQYINRLQIPDWHNQFALAGFEIVETNRLVHSDLSTIDVHAEYAHIHPSDLSCAVVQFLLKKPA